MSSVRTTLSSSKRRASGKGSGRLPMGTMQEFDVIIVGARCAGSPTAMLLARKGYRVLLVDQATFPSDTISSHHVQQPAVASLQRWGLLDKLIASDCPSTKNWIFDVGPFALHGSPTPFDGVADAYAPRRTVLDKMLVDAAVEAGAEVREDFIVQEIVFEGSRVTGMRGKSRGGLTMMEQARLV